MIPALVEAVQPENIFIGSLFISKVFPQLIAALLLVLIKQCPVTPHTAPVA